MLPAANLGNVSDLGKICLKDRNKLKPCWCQRWRQSAKTSTFPICCRRLWHRHRLGEARPEPKVIDSFSSPLLPRAFTPMFPFTDVKKRFYLNAFENQNLSFNFQHAAVSVLVFVWGSHGSILVSIILKGTGTLCCFTFVPEIKMITAHAQSVQQRRWLASVYTPKLLLRGYLIK